MVSAVKWWLKQVQNDERMVKKTMARLSSLELFDWFFEMHQK
jgi:hypothetical protein